MLDSLSTSSLLLLAHTISLPIDLRELNLPEPSSPAGSGLLHIPYPILTAHEDAKNAKSATITICCWSFLFDLYPLACFCLTYFWIRYSLCFILFEDMGILYLFYCLFCHLTFEVPYILGVLDLMLWICFDGSTWIDRIDFEGFEGFLARDKEKKEGSKEEKE